MFPTVSPIRVKYCTNLMFNRKVDKLEYNYRNDKECTRVKARNRLLNKLSCRMTEYYTTFADTCSKDFKNTYSNEKHRVHEQ